MVKLTTQDKRADEPVPSGLIRYSPSPLRNDAIPAWGSRRSHAFAFSGAAT